MLRDAAIEINCMRMALVLLNDLITPAVEILEGCVITVTKDSSHIKKNFATTRLA